jgi:hypothetical protein
VLVRRRQRRRFAGQMLRRSKYPSLPAALAEAARRA